MPSILSSLLVGIVAAAVGGHYSGYWTIPRRESHVDDIDRFQCHPFLPKLFADTPPKADHALIEDASLKLDAYLSGMFVGGGIDSLSVAVVTSEGPLFTKNWGVMRGNESGTSPPTTSHSMYRLASVSKLLLVLEGHILQQRGIISWDDPVEKYLPGFSHRADGFKPNNSYETPSITLFQLASHLSGLGRDWPSGDVVGWPRNLNGMGAPPYNGHPFPSKEALLDAIRTHQLTSPPAAYPAYSNTGTGLLGLALLAAGGDATVDSYAKLLQRDVFDPLGMNESHFLATEENKHLLVVPSLVPEVVDQDFLDAMNPAGGQFGSLSDMVTLTKMLLNPRHPSSILTQHTMDNWLHTVHSFEEDDWTESGMIWEIVKQTDSYGRPRKIYWKLGEMLGYHTAVAIHPGTSYGIIVLMTGHYADSAKLAYDAFAIFQPAIDGALSELASDMYVGVWATHDRNASIVVTLDTRRGTLFVETFSVGETEILHMFGAQGRLALRSTSRKDELRIDTGFPGPYNGQKHHGCYVYWNGQDVWGRRNGAPLNLIYFTGDVNTRELHYPALDLVLKRVEG